MSSDSRGPAEPSGALVTSSYVAALSYRQILVEEIIQGLGELRRSGTGLAFSGFSAGLDIGFSMLLMGTALTFTAGHYNEATQHLLLANLSSVGFILVVLGRSELFTEHTTLAVFPVLAGRATLRALVRLWAIIFSANICGALLFAGLLVVVGPGLDAIDDAAFESIAHKLLDHPWWVMVLSGVAAGWLMGLLSWLAGAAVHETIGRVFFVWLIATSIGLVPLHHCVLGTVEIASAMFAADSVGPLDLLRFLSAATIGNTVGGVVFVALVKYGHAIQSAQLEETSAEVLSDEHQGAIESR